jgi:hypothetical protein
VNSPKSKTPFFNAASMNATFSASTAWVRDLATLIVIYGLCIVGKEEEERVG